MVGGGLPVLGSEPGERGVGVGGGEGRGGLEEVVIYDI